jgi:glucose/arabinose dehydrogenase
MTSRARACWRLAAGLALASAARSQAALPMPVLQAELLAGGLDSPVWVGSPPGDTERVFVLELEGRVRIVKRGALLDDPFLDLTAQVIPGAQGGLLGLAFHPDYASNGWFYVYYSIGGPSSMLERYRVSSHDPDHADPSSAWPMLAAPIVSPLQYHMGGGLDFGLDGRLYLGIGDERDTPTGSCAAQRLDSLLGKILRLEDDGGIPADNPFVGVAGARPEIWDLGLRQPFRLAFDPSTGDLFIGDVGEDLREEIDLHPASLPGGMNWGWHVMEGELCTGAPQCADHPCPAPEYAAPAFAYSHDSHLCCVLGGFVYHGALVQALQGAYLYGDICTSRLYALHLAGGVALGSEALVVVAGGGVINDLVGVGVDGEGEPLLLDRALGAAGQGEVWRLRPGFTDLGGSLGPPLFSAQGAALPGSAITLSLTAAPPLAPAHLVVGAGLLGLPFKGGIMMPSVGFVLSGLAVGADGTLTLGGTWPGGLPPGTPLLLQWWLVDAAGPAGFSASNALMIIAL